MRSNKLPWAKLWPTLWGMIPDPLTDDRLLLALDDFINPRTGRKIFGCAHFFDHAAKANQSKYPWTQNVVLTGLLKRIKVRWACLPLAHKFYLPKKAIASKSERMNIPGEIPSFSTKLQQAAGMIIQVAHHFAGVPVTVVCDSWFGNNGLFKPMREHLGSSVTLQYRPSCLPAGRYSLPPTTQAKGKRSRPRKYGNRLGACTELAAGSKPETSCHWVFLYGRYREVMASTKVVMLKTLKCPVRVLRVFRKTQRIALFSTDLYRPQSEPCANHRVLWRKEES